MSDERSDSGDHLEPRASNGANGAVPEDLRSLIPLRELAEPGDEPIDFVAVQADDELVSALASGMAVSAPGVGGYDADDRVAAMLAAWRAEVDAEPIPELVDIETATAAITGPRHVRRPGRLARHLVPLSAAAALLAFTIAGVSVGAHEARPGDTLWPVTRVLYQDYAKSAEALVVVEQAQEKAKAALAVGDKEAAAAAVSQGMAAASDVRTEDGQITVVEELSRLEGEVEQTTPGVPNEQPPQESPTASPEPQESATAPPSEATESPTATDPSPTATDPSPTATDPSPDPADPTPDTEDPQRDVRSLDGPSGEPSPGPIEGSPSESPGPSESASPGPNESPSPGPSESAGPSEGPSPDPPDDEQTESPPGTSPSTDDDDETTPEPTGTAAQGTPEASPSASAEPSAPPDADADGSGDGGSEDDGVSGASSSGSGTATITGPPSVTVPSPTSEVLPVVPSEVETPPVAPSVTVESAEPSPAGSPEAPESDESPKRTPTGEEGGS